ncbi:MAG TPA: CARDB domain-containing protein [Candidatus Polarisedimenticolia bacterium]|nr:CARDB domain-containing protein [Candidatus Polarisedimenticolia bacterium]
MTKSRHNVLAITALLVLGAGAVAHAQERGQPRAVQIQTQPQPEKVAVRVRPHAELEVGHVAHTPAPAKEGQSIAIEIKVENDGTAPSSGDETLHFDCKNKQSGGPACPFGAGQRSLPVIHSLKEPYATGPYGHSVQLLTTPTWKPGTYQVTAWIVEQGAVVQPEVFTATIEVKPKLKLSSEAALTADLQATALDEPAAEVLRIDPGIAVNPVAAPDLVATVGTYGGGSLYPVGVTVKNEGLGPAAATVFRMTCDEYVGSQIVGKCLSTIEQPVPAIGSGQSASIPMPFAPALHCDPDPDPPHVDVCRVTAVVDPGNQVAESDEADNTKIYDVFPQ